MMKSVLFVISSLNSFKIYGPLLDYFEKEADGTKCILYFKNENDHKSFLEKKDYIALENIETTTLDFGDVCEKFQVSAVVNICFELPISDDEHLRLKKQGIRFYSLPYIGEEILQAEVKGEKLKGLWDKIFLTSAEWRAYFFKRCPWAKELNLEFSGYCELDQCHGFDLNQIIKKYELNVRDKKVVFLSTLPPLVMNKSFRLRLLQKIIHSNFGPIIATLLNCFRLASLFDKDLLKVVSYKSFLKNLRKSFPKDKYFIIGKTRVKHCDSDYVGDYVDVLLDDKSYFPFTTLELLFISDYYIGFESAAIIEAMALGKKGINFSIFPTESSLKEHVLSFRNHFWTKDLWCLDHLSKFSKMYENDSDLDQDLNWLKDSKSSNKSRSYFEKYFPYRLNSSEKIWITISKDLKESAHA